VIRFITIHSYLGIGSGAGYGSNLQGGGGGGYGQDNDASINPNLTATGGNNAQSFDPNDPSNTGTFDTGDNSSFGSGNQQFGQGGQGRADTDPNSMTGSNTFGSGASGVGKLGGIMGGFAVILFFHRRLITRCGVEGLRDSAGKAMGQTRKVRCVSFIFIPGY
jgi:hypothetical protein